MMPLRRKTTLRQELRILWPFMRGALVVILFGLAFWGELWALTTPRNYTHWRVGFSFVQSAQAQDKWANASPERRQWFKGLTIPDAARKRLGVKYMSCCDAGDRVKTKFEKRSGAWWFIDPIDGEPKPVPPDIIKWDTPSIDGYGYLFRNRHSKKLLCFIPPGGGT